VDDLKNLPEKFALLPCVRCPPVAQIHRQHLVAVLQEREINRHVRAGTRVRLDVGVFRAEKFFARSIASCSMEVNIFRSRHTSVFLDSLRVFIRHQHRALRFHHRRAGEIFQTRSARCFLLTFAFVFNRRGDFGINIQQAQFAGANFASIFNTRRSWRPLQICGDESVENFFGGFRAEFFFPLKQSTFTSLCWRINTASCSCLGDPRADTD